MKYRIRIEGDREQVRNILDTLYTTEVNQEAYDWFNDTVSRMRQQDDTLNNATFILEREPMPSDWIALMRHEGVETRSV